MAASPPKWSGQTDRLFAWKIGPGGQRTWVGEFLDIKDYRAWLKKQPSGEYALNNIPPHTSPSWLKPGAPPMPDEIKPEGWQPMVRPPRPARQTTRPVGARPVPQPKVEDTAESKAAKKAAKKALAQHMQAEADEIRGLKYEDTDDGQVN